MKHLQVGDKCVIEPQTFYSVQCRNGIQIRNLKKTPDPYQTWWNDIPYFFVQYLMNKILQMIYAIITQNICKGLKVFHISFRSEATLWTKFPSLTNSPVCNSVSQSFSQCAIFIFLGANFLCEHDCPPLIHWLSPSFCWHTYLRPPNIFSPADWT